LRTSQSANCHFFDWLAQPDDARVARSISNAPTLAEVTRRRIEGSSIIAMTACDIGIVPSPNQKS
jgi:hypothetical protein